MGGGTKAHILNSGGGGVAPKVPPPMTNPEFHLGTACIVSLYLAILSKSYSASFHFSILL